MLISTHETVSNIYDYTILKRLYIIYNFEWFRTACAAEAAENNERKALPDH